MADDETGCGRVVLETDVRGARERRPLGPSGDFILRKEHAASLQTLIDADHEIGKMFDELAAEFDTTRDGHMTFAKSTVAAIQKLQIRCAQLEARTLGGRIRRLRGWCTQLAARFDRFVLDVVSVFDPETPVPTRVADNASAPSLSPTEDHAP